MLVNKLLHGLRGIHGKGKSVAPYFKFDIGIIYRVNAGKFLVGRLDAVEVSMVGHYLELVEVRKLPRGIFSAGFHPRNGGVIKEVGKPIVFWGDETLGTVVIERAWQQHHGRNAEKLDRIRNGHGHFVFIRLGHQLQVPDHEVLLGEENVQEVIEECLVGSRKDQRDLGRIEMKAFSANLDLALQAGKVELFIIGKVLVAPYHNKPFDGLGQQKLVVKRNVGPPVF